MCPRLGDVWTKPQTEKALELTATGTVDYQTKNATVQSLNSQHHHLILGVEILLDLYFWCLMRDFLTKSRIDAPNETFHHNPF